MDPRLLDRYARAGEVARRSSERVVRAWRRVQNNQRCSGTLDAAFGGGSTLPLLIPSEVRPVEMRRRVAHLERLAP